MRIDIRGLDGVAKLLREEVRSRVPRAASMAINHAARRARTRSAKEMRRQVAVSAKEVSPSGDLRVSRHSSPATLTAAITAGFRPVSLARYVVGTPRKSGGVFVQVKPGRTKYMRKAFLVRLRRGTAPVTAKNHNLGLAIRLGKGRRVYNKKYMKPLYAGKDTGVYLLYGPSPQQMFINRGGGGIARAQERQIVSDMEDEFLRLMRLDKL